MVEILHGKILAGRGLTRHVDHGILRSQPRPCEVIGLHPLGPRGYTATRHQREVGAGYVDAVVTTISGGAASTLALAGSTELAQFEGGCGE